MNIHTQLMFKNIYSLFDLYIFGGSDTDGFLSRKTLFAILSDFITRIQRFYIHMCAIAFDIELNFFG